MAHLNISAEISILGVLPKDIPIIDPQTISPGTLVLCLYVHLEKNEEFKCVGVATAAAANSNEEFIINQAREKTRVMWNGNLRRRLKLKRMPWD